MVESDRMVKKIIPHTIVLITKKHDAKIDEVIYFPSEQKTHF